MVDYSHFDATFHALSDSTRRAILEQLMQGPARVSELAEPFSMSLNAVSKHVQILERAGLVKREVRGREHWIRFRKRPLKDARNWATSMLNFWDSRHDETDASDPT
mgnify:FL=1